jgi:ABC-type transport system substrate-binding protein
MKLILSVAALIVAVALAAPAEAATKKPKKTVHRAPVSTTFVRPAVHPYDVYVSGEWVGRDPDPAIRAFMMRNPHIWDGPE